jgi:hypothetical protein
VQHGSDETLSPLLFSGLHSYAACKLFFTTKQTLESKYRFRNEYQHIHDFISEGADLKSCSPQPKRDPSPRLMNSKKIDKSLVF